MPSLWWLLLTIGMSGFIIGQYGHILRDPDAVVLSGSGDGLKNYYTLLWQANRDSHWLDYSGSNYPFGERVVYTDGHPLLGWGLRLLPGLAPHAVGVLNALLILGLLICAWCLFALLKELDMVPWAAAVGAFAITLLQPQVFRLGGHYSLAHPWFIPLFMLLSVKLHRQGRWIWPAVLAAVTLLAAFLTHPYLGLMGAMLLLAHGLCRFILGPWRLSVFGASILRPFAVVAPPLLLFLFLLSAGDIVQDRPTGPMGADVYATRFLSLILPIDDPFATPLKEFVRYDRLEWESWCYLGLSSMLVLVIAGGVELRRWILRWPRAHADETVSLLAAGFLVLLFAMGVWQDLLNGSLPMLDQFRGTGRFAWPFFFASAVFCAKRTHQWLLIPDERRRGAAAITYVVVVGFMAVEGWAYHRKSSEALGRLANPFRIDALSQDQRRLVHTIKDSGARAILPLPWMHTGSERYARHVPETQLAFVLPIAYHSGLPLMAGITSRTSMQQTQDLFAVFAPSYFPKPLQETIPPDTKLLLVRHKDSLSHAEEAVWSRARQLYQDPEVVIREISAATLLLDDRAKRLASFDSIRTALPRSGAWLFSSNGHPAPAFMVAQAHFGADSITGTVADYTELLVLRPADLDTAVTYELSFLYSASDPMDLNNNVITVHAATDSSGAEWDDLQGVRSMPMQLGGGAAVACISIKPKHADRAYRFLMNGPSKRNARYTVRHVLLRPIELDVWRAGTWAGRRTVFLNNVPLSGDSRAAAP